MSISRLLLRIAGWKVNITVPDYPKCIICVAPHTSNWDFILGKLAYASVGRKAGFLMKESWFFFPLGCIFRALGGIPVPRKKGSSLVDTIIEKYNSSESMSLAITPEGTRSRTDKWRSGFLYIAYGAKIPIVLGAIDYSAKDIIIERTFIPTGDAEADMKAIKDYYRPFKGRYPDKFSAE
ncbi:MAG: lysophospholipid acyltransferase family protein [Paramuribaculum sp.]|nr:lysophospholipid acyltransferase family protein [Paramuribaculum sp.]